MAFIQRGALSRISGDLEKAMSRRLKQIAAVLVVVFTAAQLFRPERTNPPTGASRTIQAQMETAGGLVAVLDRACSNRTVWLWSKRLDGL